MLDRRRFIAIAVGAAVLVGLAAAGATEIGGRRAAPGQTAPDLAPGAWINSEPLTIPGLRGRVVLVEFWTYG